MRLDGEGITASCHHWSESRPDVEWEIRTVKWKDVEELRLERDLGGTIDLVFAVPNDDQQVPLSILWSDLSDPEGFQRSVEALSKRRFRTTQRRSDPQPVPPPEPSFRDLVGGDPQLRNLLWAGVAIVIGPLLLMAFSTLEYFGGKSLGEHAGLLGLVLPALVILGMAYSRWRTLARLSARGIQVPGVVERAGSNRDGGWATIRFSLGGLDRRVTLKVPGRIRCIESGSSATLLVDPEKPSRATLVAVRSVIGGGTELGATLERGTGTRAP